MTLSSARTSHGDDSPGRNRKPTHAQAPAGLRFAAASFQSLEKPVPNFPMPGKNPSKVWKNGLNFFQCSEKLLAKFPTPGNISSNLRNAEPKFFQPSDGILPDLGQLAGFFPESGKKSSDPWNAARARGPGRSPALRGAVKDASTDWNDGVSFVSKRFTFLVSPQRDPPSGRCACASRPLFFPVLTGNVKRPETSTP